ncbi:MAG: hypothetical protein EpisKO_04240 [Epibacterium sp.]
MVTLEECYQHLNLRVEKNGIGEGGVDEGDKRELQRFIDTACDHLKSIGVDVSQEPLPPAIHHAILLLVGHFYKNRQATTHEQVRFTPIGVDRLIAPYRSVVL